MNSLKLPIVFAAILFSVFTTLNAQTPYYISDADGISSDDQQGPEWVEPVEENHLRFAVQYNFFGDTMIVQVWDETDMPSEFLFQYMRAGFGIDTMNILNLPGFTQGTPEYKLKFVLVDPGTSQQPPGFVAKSVRSITFYDPTLWTDGLVVQNANSVSIRAHAMGYGGDENYYDYNVAAHIIGPGGPINPAPQDIGNGVPEVDVIVELNPWQSGYYTFCFDGVYVDIVAPYRFQPTPIKSCVDAGSGDFWWIITGVSDTIGIATNDDPSEQIQQSVYPNPIVNNQVRFHWWVTDANGDSKFVSQNLLMSDVYGRYIREFHSSVGLQDVSELASGLYFITDQKNGITVRFIKP